LIFKEIKAKKRKLTSTPHFLPYLGGSFFSPSLFPFLFLKQKVEIWNFHPFSLPSVSIKSNGNLLFWGKIV